MSFVSISLMKDKIIFFKGAIWGLLVISILGLLSYLGIIHINDSVLVYKNSVRLQSVIQYANVTGVLMGIGFFLSYYFISHYDKFQETVKYYIFSHLFLLSLIFTQSRGAIISLILCILIWFLLLKNSKTIFYVLTNFVLSFISGYLVSILIIGEKKFLAVLVFVVSSMAAGYIYYIVNIKIKGLSYRKINLLIVILLIISTVILFNSQLDRIFQISIFHGTFILRFIYFKDGLRVIKENFLLGIGPGNWTSQQFFYQTAKYYVKYIHNGLVQIALDAGILSLITFIFIVGLYSKKSIKNFKESNAGKAITLIIILFYILLHSLIDIDLSFTSILMIISGILAVDTDTSFCTNNKIRIDLFKALGLTFSGLAIGIGIFLLVGQNYYNNGEYYFIHRKYDRAIQYYEKSILFRPYDNHPYLRLSICYEMVNKNKEKSIEMLGKANLLDTHDPRPLKELIRTGQLYQDNQLVYNSSIKLIDINRFDILGYESGLIASLNMYENKIITDDEFNKNIKLILNKLDMTNRERDLRSKYVEHNDKLIVADDLMKKIKPLRK
ncbi:O-antigen ligase family protein [Wukongibacter baidiensis]|uniref:O-antigen ligase family protein n=1 Tax=Wukongibacter baidiensis TaxID=1723361 RepID=UPI003D7F560B